MVSVQVLLLSVLCLCPGLVFARRIIAAKSDSLEASRSNQSTAGDFDGCYCKKVESSEECPYSMKPADVDGLTTVIQQTRFFHSQDNGNLCCKWASDSFFSWTGRGYKRQETTDLCTVNVADVPKTSCCLLRDAFGTMGVRVSRAARNFAVHQPEFSWLSPQMKITNAIIQVSDIIGSADLSGAPIAQTDAQAFVKEKLKEVPLQCQSPDKECRLLANGQKDCYLLMEKLVTTEVPDEECRLLSESPKQCCCLTEYVQTATRCLPNQGSPTASDAQRIEWQATLEEYSSHGHTETEIKWENPFGNEFKDEEGNQMAPTENDDGHTYIWQLQPIQWNDACSKNGIVKTVERYETTETHMVMWGGTPTTRSQKVTRYKQGEKQVCVQRTLTRKCGPGHAMYDKIIPQGKCLTDESGLVQNPKFVYKCPEKHVSSQSNNLCTCPGTSCSKYKCPESHVSSQFNTLCTCPGTSCNK